MKKILCLFVAIAFSLQPSAFGLEIANTAISNVTRISATYYGELVSTNGSGTNPAVTLYYGTSDSGTNATNWTYSCTFSNVAIGSFSTNLSGLTPARYYYCRPSAIEGTNTAWAAASTSFWTVAGAPTGSYPAATGGVFQIVSTNGEWLGPTKAKVIAANDLATSSQVSNFQSLISTFPAAWSGYPATQDVNVANHGLTNVASLSLGGDTRSNWPAHGTGDVATWSFYPATQDVDIAEHGIKFGSVTRTNWPVDATDVAASNAALGIRVGTLETGLTNAQNAISNNLVSAWSGYPATQDVNVANHGLTNVASLSLGGDTRTNWPTGVDASDWAQYPANQDVDWDNYAIYGVGGIELGGVMRLTWPEPSTAWASTPASTNINLAGFSISNGAFFGNGAGLTNLGVNTWSAYPAVSNINLAGKSVSNGAFFGNGAGLSNLVNNWSFYPATQTVNMANRGLANVASIGLGGITRTNWWQESDHLRVAKVSVGPTNIIFPEPLNILGNNKTAYLNYSIYTSNNSGSAEQYPVAVEEMDLLDDNYHGWTNISYIVDEYLTNCASGVDIGSKASKRLRFTGWTNIPSDALMTGVVVQVHCGGREETHSAWLIQDGITSSVQNVYHPYGDQTLSFGSSTSLWGLEKLTSDFAVDFRMGAHPYTFGHPLYWCKVTAYYRTGFNSWITGINSSGNYSIANNFFSRDIRLSITPTNIIFNVPLSVPQITLGTGAPITNWPAVAQLDTNQTSVATLYTPRFIGDTLVGGAGAGTNAVWISKGTTTNDWIAIKP